MRGLRSLEVWKLGVVNYLDALKLQEKLALERKLHKRRDTLLSLQHPPTYTVGKRQTVHNLLIPQPELEKIGAELHYTQRGGDITFHGPHQAILYPILSLRDMGLGARKRKIGAIGVRISSGITSHGMAFNIDPDLSYFRHIVPCGIADKEVTSLRRETDFVLPEEEIIQKQLISCFARIFGYSNLIWKEDASTIFDKETE
uniref:lipoyl(octanoyl) transferase n=1 Tax=Cajanus cajan TaxID=3821 RepID=A0A151U7H9_CAJCA|nr:Octanoyltransferase [Cajanus cajan]